ncbi:hypothetical protein RHMOL_Rhmol04G0250700 [Rhododendron molle]|uniref:Uncharacterized protein n=1 Tax=Rhododendron molle TaxID=49168 RepID=A0ACC0P5F8_RHOML|nr:hypothetical protein RHMOL_Rhmol04G0250700 [Rhododendron molle]
MADGAPASPGGGSHESGGDQSPRSSNVREQDRFLPIANISRIMKKALPSNGKIAKDAKETVQECVSEFISFVTSEYEIYLFVFVCIYLDMSRASDKCQREKRKTINGDDLLWAMATLGFEDYIEPLKVYLTRYREFSVPVEVTIFLFVCFCYGLNGMLQMEVCHVFLMMDFARVTLRDQRRVGKGLVERMRFNLVQMLSFFIRVHFHKASITGILRKGQSCHAQLQNQFGLFSISLSFSLCGGKRGDGGGWSVGDAEASKVVGDGFGAKGVGYCGSWWRIEGVERGNNGLDCSWCW